MTDELNALVARDKMKRQALIDIAEVIGDHATHDQIMRLRCALWDLQFDPPTGRQRRARPRPLPEQTAEMLVEALDGATHCWEGQWGFLDAEEA